MKEQITAEKIGGKRTKRLNLDVPITAENLQFCGKRTAVCALKGILIYENTAFMRRTFIRLLNDIDRFNTPGYTLTDSYDIVQEAILFYCKHIGRKPADLVVTEKGKTVTVLKACLQTLTSYVRRGYRKALGTVQLGDKLCNEIAVPFEWEVKSEIEAEKIEAANYASVDKRIEAMRLTPNQKKVLACRLSGKSVTETARALCVIRSTVTSSLYYIQLKYNKSFEHVSYCPAMNKSNLTDCENRILNYYLRGVTVKEIARAFSVSRQAIEKTLKRVQGKIRGQAV